MRTENGLLIDIAEFSNVIDSADVFAMGFRQFPERLLVDTRSNSTDGSLVTVVEPLKSAAERFFWLGQKRPTFGLPERFMFFPWPHSIAFLEESGVWAHICERVNSDGSRETRALLDDVLADLTRRDHEASVAAITGIGYRQVWPKSSRRA